MNYSIFFEIDSENFVSSTNIFGIEISELSTSKTTFGSLSIENKFRTTFYYPLWVLTGSTGGARIVVTLSMFSAFLRNSFSNERNWEELKSCFKKKKLVFVYILLTDQKGVDVKIIDLVNWQSDTLFILLILRNILIKVTMILRILNRNEMYNISLFSRFYIEFFRRN